MIDPTIKNSINNRSTPQGKHTARNQAHKARIKEGQAHRSAPARTNWNLGNLKSLALPAIVMGLATIVQKGHASDSPSSSPSSAPTGFDCDALDQYRNETDSSMTQLTSPYPDLFSGILDKFNPLNGTVRNDTFWEIPTQSIETYVADAKGEVQTEIDASGGSLNTTVIDNSRDQLITQVTDPLNSLFQNITDANGLTSTAFTSLYDDCFSGGNYGEDGSFDGLCDSVGAQKGVLDTRYTSIADQVQALIASVTQLITDGFDTLKTELEASSGGSVDSVSVDQIFQGLATNITTLFTTYNAPIRTTLEGMVAGLGVSIEAAKKSDEQFSQIRIDDANLVDSAAEAALWNQCIEEHAQQAALETANGVIATQAETISIFNASLRECDSGFAQCQSDLTDAQTNYSTLLGLYNQSQTEVATANTNATYGWGNASFWERAYNASQQELDQCQQGGGSPSPTWASTGSPTTGSPSAATTGAPSVVVTGGSTGSAVPTPAGTPAPSTAPVTSPVPTSGGTPAPTGASTNGESPAPTTDATGTSTDSAVPTPAGSPAPSAAPLTSPAPTVVVTGGQTGAPTGEIYVPTTLPTGMPSNTENGDTFSVVHSNAVSGTHSVSHSVFFSAEVSGFNSMRFSSLQSNSYSVVPSDLEQCLQDLSEADSESDYWKGAWSSASANASLGWANYNQCSETNGTDDVVLNDTHAPTPASTNAPSGASFASPTGAPSPVTILSNDDVTDDSQCQADLDQCQAALDLCNSASGVGNESSSDSAQNNLYGIGGFVAGMMALFLIQKGKEFLDYMRERDPQDKREADGAAYIQIGGASSEEGPDPENGEGNGPQIRNGYQVIHATNAIGTQTDDVVTEAADGAEEPVRQRPKSAGYKVGDFTTPLPASVRPRRKSANDVAIVGAIASSQRPKTAGNKKGDFTATLPERVVPLRPVVPSLPLQVLSQTDPKGDRSVTVDPSRLSFQPNLTQDKAVGNGGELGSGSYPRPSSGSRPSDQVEAFAADEQQDDTSVYEGDHDIFEELGSEHSSGGVSYTGALSAQNPVSPRKQSTPPTGVPVRQLMSNWTGGATPPGGNGELVLDSPAPTPSRTKPTPKKGSLSRVQPTADPKPTFSKSVLGEDESGKEEPFPKLTGDLSTKQSVPGPSMRDLTGAAALRRFASANPNPNPSRSNPRGQRGGVAVVSSSSSSQDQAVPGVLTTPRAGITYMSASEPRPKNPERQGVVSNESHTPKGTRSSAIRSSGISTIITRTGGDSGVPIVQGSNNTSSNEEELGQHYLGNRVPLGGSTASTWVPPGHHAPIVRPSSEEESVSSSPKTIGENGQGTIVDISGPNAPSTPQFGPTTPAAASAFEPKSAKK
ncbi:hypothetical protein HOH87_01760 [bacterium]|nr:hypothetical protein [bacterium]